MQRNYFIEGNLKKVEAKMRAQEPNLLRAPPS
jgi:hypothetical protein